MANFWPSQVNLLGKMTFSYFLLEAVRVDGQEQRPMRTNSTILVVRVASAETNYHLYGRSRAS